MKSEKPAPKPAPALKIAPPPPEMLAAPEVQPQKPRTASTGRLEIESDIPLPVDLARGQKAGYPYADLEVGESFFVPRRDFGVQNKIKGRLFVTRKWEKDGVKGRRVWRVK